MKPGESFGTKALEPKTKRAGTVRQLPYEYGRALWTLADGQVLLSQATTGDHNVVCLRIISQDWLDKFEQFTRNSAEKLFKELDKAGNGQISGERASGSRSDTKLALRVSVPSG